MRHVICVDRNGDHDEYGGADTPVGRIVGVSQSQLWSSLYAGRETEWLRKSEGAWSKNLEFIQGQIYPFKQLF